MDHTSTPLGPSDLTSQKLRAPPRRLLLLKNAESSKDTPIESLQQLFQPKSDGMMFMYDGRGIVWMSESCVLKWFGKMGAYIPPPAKAERPNLIGEGFRAGVIHRIGGAT